MMEAKKAPKDVEPCLGGNRRTCSVTERNNTMSMSMFMMLAKKSPEDSEPCLKRDCSSASVSSSCSTTEGEPQPLSDCRTPTSLSDSSYSSESSQGNTPRNICSWSLPEGLNDEEAPMQAPSSRPMVQVMKKHNLPQVVSLGELPTSMNSTCHGPSDAETEIVQVSKQSDNAVIIFDWDDTLFPTAYFRNWVLPSLSFAEVAQFKRLSPESPHYNKLRRHAVVVEQVLRGAASVARVKIVTLATECWLEESAEHFLPGLNLSKLLRQLDVEVLHADRQSKDCVKAKRHSMAKCLRSPYADYPDYSWNVMSVGDSTIEREALKELFAVDRTSRNGDRRCGFCKTLKLQDTPTLSVLTEDLQALTQRLADLVSLEQDFDLQFRGNV
jgi:hypothetical protein